MPTYDYKCSECKRIREYNYIPDETPMCACILGATNSYVPMSRVYTFVTTGMPTNAGVKMRVRNAD